MQLKGALRWKKLIMMLFLEDPRYASDSSADARYANMYKKLAAAWAQTEGQFGIGA